MSNLGRTVMSRGMTRPPMDPVKGKSRSGRPGSCDYSPVHWSKYFNAKEMVDIGGGSNYCVYRSSNSSAPGTPTILLFHGGGFSALSWCLTVDHLMKIMECHVVAVDLRGHGETQTNDDYKLNTSNLVSDLLNLSRSLKLNEGPIIVVGHSLGGALASYFSQDAHFFGDFQVLGLVVIDVVEGSALESLANMNSVLRNRPNSFPSLEKAIQWCVRSGQVRNVESARVSMPGQLKSVTTQEPATLFVSPEGESDNKPPTGSSFEDSESLHNEKLNASGVILEEPESCEENSTFVVPVAHSSVPANVVQSGYTWRIDLNKTEPFWNDWFQGLSLKFLDTPCPKLLLLAGVDRLDKELMVGQMQGKFQMQVLPNVGHAIHEDSPEEVANSIGAFLVRHKMVKAKVNFQPTLPGC